MALHELSPRGKNSGLSRQLVILTLLLGTLGSCSRGDRPDAASKPGNGSHAADTGSAIVLHDAQNEEVRLAGPATRVISLAPSITEIMFAIGAGPKLVGRTTYCDYPPEALKVAPVGDMLALNYEAVVAAKPDLILMTHVGDIKSNYEKLRDLGFTACTIGDETVDGVIGALDTVGLLVGRREEANRLGTKLKWEIDSIRALAKQTPLVTAFVVIDKAPLITASSGFLAEEMEIAGADNIAKGGVTAYPKYSREELLRRDPEVIIIPGMSFSMVDELLAAYPEWKGLRAVRNNRVYVLPHNTIFRPGPRIATSIDLLYRALHGADARELFDDAMKGK
jgi:iron complex transport system substrate-binding protein